MATDSPPARPDVAALFDRVSDTYDAVDVPWFEPIAVHLLAQLRPAPGERAVDLGCGRGAVTRPLADAVGPTGRVVAIDLAPGMVERTAADLSALAHVQVRLGDARTPDLPPGEWDVVASSLVLFFLPDPMDAVRRWADLLRPGGRLGVTTFGAQDQRWEAVDELFTPYLPAGLRDARTSGRRGPFASDDGVEDLLRGAGLSDVRTTSETVVARFRDVEHWTRWSRSHGQRAMWDCVPAQEQPALVARAAALFAGALELTQVVRCTTGRRPASGDELDEQDRLLVVPSGDLRRTAEQAPALRDAGPPPDPRQPRVNGSRVAPVSSTHTDLVSVYSRTASAPFSRPMPLAPKPPKGTCGATTR